jgi:hypothetical protein
VVWISWALSSGPVTGPFPLAFNLRGITSLCEDAALIRTVPAIGIMNEISWPAALFIHFPVSWSGACSA